MRVVPLGVGDAFDPDEANSSCLVEHAGFVLLIDCGHSVPGKLWRARPEPDAVDAVFLTHLHADHVGGLAPVIDSWSWAGRRKELVVHTTARGRAVVAALCDLLDIHPRFAVRYVESGAADRLGPFALRTAPTEHPLPNLALRLEADGRRLAYSGDGRPTAASRALFADADLLLHECWQPDAAPEIGFHADLPTVRGIAGPPRIGLYHVKAGLRPAMRERLAGDPRLFLLEPGTVLAV